MSSLTASFQSTIDALNQQVAQLNERVAELLAAAQRRQRNVSVTGAAIQVRDEAQANVAKVVSVAFRSRNNDAATRKLMAPIARSRRQ